MVLFLISEFSQPTPIILASHISAFYVFCSSLYALSWPQAQSVSHFRKEFDSHQADFFFGIFVFAELVEGSVN